MNTVCRICQGTSLKEVMDFGEVALAGGFLKASQIHAERKYPLRLAFCEHCFTVQLAESVAPEILFSDYRYFSSQISTVRRHFDKYAEDVFRFKPRRVLEIGCNDGYLLSRMADKGAECVGIDPAANVLESVKDDRLTLVNAFFGEQTELGRFDMIIANNVFAHMPDLHGATRAMRKALTDDGVLVIETHHLGAMVRDLQYDWVYHEHLFYWSCLALAMHLNRHGLCIFDVQPIALHGGSMRYFVCHQGARPASRAVEDLMRQERKEGLDSAGTFRKFAVRAACNRIVLVSIVQNIVKSGGTVAGYGASGRANTILQWCGFDASQITHLVDDAPARQGYYTPGSHLPIYAPDNPRATRPTYMLVLAWPYAEEILPKLDMPAIVPLPQVAVPERAAA